MTMQIKLNGEERSINSGSTISALLNEIGIEPKNLAVEHNGDFLEPTEFETRIIGEGDTVEIVRFVGGG